MSVKNGFYKDGYYEDDLLIRPSSSTLAEAQDDSNKLYFYPVAYNNNPWTIPAKKAVYITGISSGFTYTVVHNGVTFGTFEVGTTFNTLGEALDAAGGNVEGEVRDVTLIDLYGAESTIHTYGPGSTLPSGAFSIGVLMNGVKQPPINGFQIIEAIDKNFAKYAYYVSTSGFWLTVPLKNGIYQDNNHYWNSVATPLPLYPTHVWEHYLDGTQARRWWKGNGNGSTGIEGRSLVTGSYAQGKFINGIQQAPAGIVEWFQASDGDNQWYYYHTNLARQYKTIRLRTGVFLADNATSTNQYVAYGLTSPVQSPDVKILKTYDENGNYKRIGYSAATNGESPTIASPGNYKCGTIGNFGVLEHPQAPTPDIVDAENPSDPAYPKLARWFEIIPQQVKLKNTIINGEVYYGGNKLNTVLTTEPPYDTNNGPFYMTIVNRNGPPIVRAYRVIGPTPSDCILVNTQDLLLLNN